MALNNVGDEHGVKGYMIIYTDSFLILTYLKSSQF